MKNPQYDRLPYPSGVALRLTLGLRRGSTYLHYRRTQPPACAGGSIPSALPSSQPQTLALDQPSGPASRTNLQPSSAAALLSIALQSTSGSRLQSTFGPACEPNRQLSSAAVSSGAAFQPTCDLRRLPTFPPCLPTCLRLATLTDLPAFPSDPTSDFHRLLHLRLCLPANLRLAPPINVSASPSDQSPAFALDQSSGSAFQPASGLRLPPGFPASP